MITKTFAALGILQTIDMIFANYLPKSVKENGKALNSSGKLKLTKNHNTLRLILSRVC